jgi:hypothetical protein
MPGITISPNPSSENSPLVVAVANTRGNNNLIGPSKFFATVTITSVPNTQNIS